MGTCLQSRGCWGCAYGYPAVESISQHRQIVKVDKRDMKSWYHLLLTSLTTGNHTVNTPPLSLVDTSSFSSLIGQHRRRARVVFFRCVDTWHIYRLSLNCLLSQALNYSLRLNTHIYTILTSSLIFQFTFTLLYLKRLLPWKSVDVFPLKNHKC